MNLSEIKERFDRMHCSNNDLSTTNHTVTTFNDSVITESSNRSFRAIWGYSVGSIQHDEEEPVWGGAQHKGEHHYLSEEENTAQRSKKKKNDLDKKKKKRKKKKKDDGLPDFDYMAQNQEDIWLKKISDLSQ